MIDRRAGVTCGPVVLTWPQFRERVADTAARRSVLPGAVVPIFERTALDAFIVALAVKEAGGIPAVGDQRWSPEYRAGLVGAVDGATASVPGWATFSSGSAGSPRVIIRTDASWSDSFDTVSALAGLSGADTVLAPSPLASSLSLFAAAHALATGIGLRLSCGTDDLADDIAQATALHSTPQVLRRVVDAIEAGAAHGIRVALVGGSHLDASLRARAEALGIRVIGYFGAAELSFVAVDADGSGHRPFPGVELRDVDGELWVRSPYLATGYLAGMGERSGPLRRDEFGWATVGDSVETGDSVESGDSAGTFRFPGRRDGAIQTASATVIPEDVESALRSIDGVDDAVVFGIPAGAHDGIGALVAVVIEPTPGRPAPPARVLRESARARLTSSHLPRRWFVAEALPRTSSGKPARARIHEDAVSGRLVRLD